MNRLPKNYNKRIREAIRYEKQVFGHHVQVDVKFLIFKDYREGEIKRYQYTAIDDTTSIRALKVYDRHTQRNAIDFVGLCEEEIPFPHSNHKNG